MHPNTPDPRLSVIAAWLQTLPNCAFNPQSLQPASSDASFRRYFRVWDEATGQACIVMDAPPDKEDIRPFVSIAHTLQAAGVRVPQILATNLEAGLLLLQDFGGTTLLQALHAEPIASAGSQTNPSPQADGLYRQALADLVQLQAQAPVAALTPYSAEKLHAEMALFGEWFVGKHHQSSLSTEEQNTLHQLQAVLVNDALAQGQVFVHRDYHSRNIMVLNPAPQATLGLLDFQDAVCGPLAYDVVSLLRDAYIEWPEAQTLDWAIRYWEQARKAGLPVPHDASVFYQQFDFIGLQRQLKVLGIFARLYHRDGKSGYLADLPLVQAYVRRVAGRYSVFKPLLRLLDRLENGGSVQVGLTF